MKISENLDNNIENNYYFKSKLPLFISCQISDQNVFSPFLKYTNKLFHLDVRGIEEIIHKSEGLIGLSLYGSLNAEKAIMRILNLCKEKDVKVGIDLNCNLNELKLLKKILKYIDLVRITVFSLDERKHEKYYSQFNDYLSIITALRTSVEYNIKLIIFPLTDENIDEFENIYCFCRKMKIKLNPIFIPKTSKLLLTYHNYNQFIHSLKKINDFNNIYIDFPTSCRDIRQSSVCPAMRYSIDAIGDRLRPCKFAGFTIGPTYDLKKIWENYDWNFSNKCKVCEFFRKCGGGCLLNRNKKNNTDFYCK